MRKALECLKCADPVIAALIEKVGPYKIRYLEPDFETLVKSIVYQQLSGKAAATIFARLVTAAGNGKLDPEAVLHLGPAKLRALGLSRQKIAYIRDIASHTRSGAVDFQSLRKLPDEEVSRVLTGLTGVGVWTAHMFLMFALRRRDVLPIGDLGIRAAIR